MGSDRVTLLDIAQQTDPDGSPAMVIEVLQQNLPMLQDAPAFASNGELSERTTLRSSNPTVQFSQINKGTPRSKSSTRQQVDTIGFLSALSEADSRLLGTSGDAAVNAFRMGEDKAFMEAMAQRVALTMLTGNESLSPQEFTGLFPRLETLNESIEGSIVLSQGTPGGGDTSSLLCVDWGEGGAHLIYPKKAAAGYTAGLKTEDLGKQRVLDANSDAFMAFVTEFTWLVGLAVKDPRRIARLANIDLSDAALVSPTQGTLWRSLNKMFALMPQRNGMNRVLYGSRGLVSSFWSQVTEKANLQLQILDYLGEPVLHFQGVPIRPMDQMPEAQRTVS